VATEKVIETNKGIHLTTSSNTISLIKSKVSTGMSSSDEAIDLEVEEITERAEEN